MPGFEIRNLEPERLACLVGLLVATARPPRLVDQLMQGFVQPRYQSATMVAAQNLANFGIQNRLQRGARTRGHLRQGKGLTLTDPDQAPDAVQPRDAAAAAVAATEQRFERVFRRLAVQMPAVGQRELGARAPEETLLDAVWLAIDLELQGDPRRCPLVAGGLEALDRLRLRAMALEQNRLQRREQRRLAHLVGAEDEVEPIVHARDPDRPVELAELLELEGAQLHRALSLRCST